MENIEILENKMLTAITSKLVIIESQKNIADKYAAKECAIVSKKIAIGFADWININSYINSSDDLWYKNSDGDTSKGITIDDLFEFYDS